MTKNWTGQTRFNLASSTEEQNKYDAAGQVFWLIRSSGIYLPGISSSGLRLMPASVRIYSYGDSSGFSPDSLLKAIIFRNRLPFGGAKILF